MFQPKPMTHLLIAASKEQMASVVTELCKYCARYCNPLYLPFRKPNAVFADQSVKPLWKVGNKLANLTN